MKTVRFTQVVQRCGRPHVHTLWLAPEKDAELSRARKADRVMTLLPSASGSADAGHVGFEPKPSHDTQFLIFPKSLKRFEGARVVGIKFELVDQPKLVPAVPTPPRRVPRQRPPSRFQRPAARSAPATPTRSPSPTVAPAEAEHVTKRIRQREHPPQKKPPPPAEKKNRSDPPLLRAVRAALKELQQGKAVAAYQRLQRAVEDSDA